MELKSLMFGVSRILIFVEKIKTFGVITYTVNGMIKINQQQTAWPVTVVPIVSC